MERSLGPADAGSPDQFGLAQRAARAGAEGPRGSASHPVRVLLVDDQALFRGALSSLIDASDEFEVVGQAENGRLGIDLALQTRPDVVLMDVEMPVMDGISAAGALFERLPGVRIVMLTVSEDDDHLLAAIRLGVHGYLLKNTTPADFFAMLRQVMRQETSVSPQLVGRLLAELRAPAVAPRPAEAPEQLSPRELEIMRLVADGLTNREIGQRLFITEGTVKNHVHNALGKLHVTTRSQAAAYLIREGIAAR